MKSLSFQIASLFAACLATVCLTVASSSAPARANACTIGIRA